MAAATTALHATSVASIASGLVSVAHVLSAGVMARAWSMNVPPISLRSHSMSPTWRPSKQCCHLVLGPREP
eukprot:5343280-Pyramimonas_sp.AAC.1